ncbi:MAG: hypothetical protein ACKESC_00975 [Candidatus Hodgkinia cicadicola]
MKTTIRTISLKSVIKKGKIFTSVNREDYPYIERITTLIKTGILYLPYKQQI